MEEEVGTAVGGVPVTVGVMVMVGTTVPVEPPAREMIGLTHKERSPVGEPYAEVTRINFTSCPAKELRFRLTLYVQPSYFSRKVQKVFTAPVPI